MQIYCFNATVENGERSKVTQPSQQIQVPNIEEELNQIWDSNLAKDKIRANLFTLIIYAYDKRRQQFLNDIVEAILEKFPCRLIFIKGNEDPESDYLNVTVSTVTSSKKDTQALIACDQIVIEVGLKQLKRVPFLVLPHILPDLPVHLLWGQDPTTEHEIFPHLQQFASRIIFDSDWINDLQIFSEKILEIIKKEPIDVLDLNWAMIFGWIDVMNTIFHSKDDYIHLYHAKDLLITYNSKKTEYVHHPEIQAIYLQGWLASCLKWNFKNIQKYEDSTKLIYNNGEHDITVTLFPQQQAQSQSGSILSIDLSTTTDHYYLIARKLGQAKVIVHISSLDKCELPLTLPLPDTKQGIPFLKEIFYYGTSQHYCQMLQTLQRINWEHL